MEECRATMHPAFLPNVLWVDNTEHNIGIMAAHNLGVDRMRETGADWLVVMSAAIRFGAPGGLDFIAHLDANPGHDVLEGPCWTPDSRGQGVYGWHLIAFHRRTIDAAGRWDENFTPYGFCDLDMSLRIQRAMSIPADGRPFWVKVPCDVRDAGMAHGIHLAGVRTETNNLIDYFRRKWGRHPGASDVPAYGRPFNNPDNPIWYWPTAANGGRCAP
jgi:hypothetical protein